MERKTENNETGYVFNAIIFLNGIDTSNVAVELFAERKNSAAPERIKMSLQPSTGKEYLYMTNVITKRPATDYTVRVIPAYENILVPLENNLIAWQR